MLRLLALWVSHAYQEEHRKAAREPLLTLGSAPLEDPTFRAAMFEQLGSAELEVPVTTDIAGKKDAHAVRLDREAPEAVRKATLHRKAASAIFFESNGGMSRSKAEATLPEIKTAVGDPDLNLVDVDHVLEGLVGACFYLNWDRNRYRFGLTPNLNQILVARRGAVQEKTIEERVKKDTEELFDRGPKQVDRRSWPKRSNDVPNRPVLTLVVLGTDTPAGETGTMHRMEAILRDCDRFNESLTEAEVEIGDEVLLLRADDARKLLEPPRLARLLVRPEHTVLKSGEQASFTCAAQDQYGQPCDLPPLEWAATGGTVTSEGLFTAGENPGQFTVHARAADIEAIAEVRVTTEEKKDDRKPEVPGKRLVSWSGDVPPQKWMNFYTKVLSRFAASPELKLTVSFQIALEDDQAGSKADEARGGLKDLGLDNNVELG